MIYSERFNADSRASLADARSIFPSCDLFPFLVAVDAMFNLRGRIAMTPRGEIGGRRDRGAASGD